MLSAIIPSRTKLQRRHQCVPAVDTCEIRCILINTGESELYYSVCSFATKQNELPLNVYNMLQRLHSAKILGYLVCTNDG